MVATAVAYGEASGWQQDLYTYLREAGVTIFAYVPDGGHKHLINRSIEDPDAISVPVASEEDGVALAAGAHLGDAKAVLLMQSSGVGNCVNMFSLMRTGRFPFVGFVTMRGEFGEENPWQVPMGQGVRGVLEAMGVQVYAVERPDDVVPAARAALGIAYKSNEAVCVLLTQKLIGAKPF